MILVLVSIIYDVYTYTSKYTTNIRPIASEKNKNEINTTFVEDIIAVDTIMPGMQNALFTI